MVLFPAVAEDTVRRIREAAGSMAVVNAASADTARAALADADAFYGHITPDLLLHAPRLRWIQAPSAGLEGVLFPALAERDDITLTNMRGVYSDHIADHAFGFVLAFARGFHVSLRRQLRREWNPDVPTLHLADAVLGVVGLGGIGEEVARRGRTSGMRVIAVDARRTEKPDCVDELRGADGLDALLAASDFVVLCTPHTPETEKMIRWEQLARMKRTAFLINVGRGIVVDLADLTRALAENIIAGAGLDVLETEPLPADHPLWDAPGVLITPHTAGRSPHGDARRLGVLIENVRRFAAGERLTNIADKRRWF